MLVKSRSLRVSKNPAPPSLAGLLAHLAGFLRPPAERLLQPVEGVGQGQKAQQEADDHRVDLAPRSGMWPLPTPKAPHDTPLSVATHAHTEVRGDNDQQPQNQRTAYKQQEESHKPQCTPIATSSQLPSAMRAREASPPILLPTLAALDQRHHAPPLA